MTPRTTISVTLAISRTRRYPYYAARVLGPRTSAKTGELQVPLNLVIDSRLLLHRSNDVTVQLDAGDAVGAIIGKVIP